MYKIIETDNYDGDYPNESHLTLEDTEGQALVLIFNKVEDAAVVCKALNQVRTTDHGPRCFCVVDIAYRIQPGFQP